MTETGVTEVRQDHSKKTARFRVKGVLDSSGVEEIKSWIGKELHELKKVTVCCGKVYEIEREAAGELLKMKRKLQDNGGVFQLEKPRKIKSFLKENGFSKLLV